MDFEAEDLEVLRRVVRRVAINEAPRLVRGVTEAEILAVLPGEVASDREVVWFWSASSRAPDLLDRLALWLRPHGPWAAASVEIYTLPEGERAAGIVAHAWGSVAAGLRVCGVPDSEARAWCEAAGAVTTCRVFCLAWCEVDWIVERFKNGHA